MNSRPLSPCAHRVLEILRDPMRYRAPYGDSAGLPLPSEWVPVTFLHYEGHSFAGGAMAALEEIERRGIRVQWSTPEGVPGALVRLA